MITLDISVQRFAAKLLYTRSRTADVMTIARAARSEDVVYRRREGVNKGGRPESLSRIWTMVKNTQKEKAQKKKVCVCVSGLGRASPLKLVLKEDTITGRLR